MIDLSMLIVCIYHDKDLLYLNGQNIDDILAAEDKALLIN